MKFKPISLSIASIAVLATVSQTAAGGYAVECYKPYHHPAQYRTVYEEVMVSPGGKHVEVSPPIYGTRTRAVVVEPARKVKRVIPAVTETVYKDVMVSPGGYRWEWQIINGKKVLCKVKVPPTYRTMIKEVVVAPAQVVYDVIPAQYDEVVEPVLVSPSQKYVTYTPPQYATVARKVKVSEGRSGFKRINVAGHCGKY